MMPTDAWSWLVWVIVIGLLVFLWATVLLLTCAVVPGRPRTARDGHGTDGESSRPTTQEGISADEFAQHR